MAWGLYHGSFLVLERLGAGRWLEGLWAPARRAYTILADPALVERERPAMVIQEIAERLAVGSAGVREDVRVASGSGAVVGVSARER